MNASDCDGSDMKRTLSMIGSSSGGDGDDQLGGPDVIQNEVAAAEAVFSNHLLLSKLILYAIHDNQGDMSPKMVGVVRSVRKSWLESTTAVLKKMEEPVITLNYQNLPTQIKNCWKKGIKSLRQFVAVFSAPIRLPESFLPYKLIIDQESFFKRNYQSVLDCIRRTGAELVELEVNYPIDEVFGIPPLNFPFLRKLSFDFYDDKDEEEKQMLKVNDNYNHNPLCSLQYILLGCQGLVKLAIEEDDDIPAIPEGIKFLRLPDTLVSLELSLKLDSQELEALVFQLTRLVVLKLTLQRIPFQDGLLFKILNRFRETLKRFDAFSLWQDREDGPWPRTYLQFPVMEKLEELCLNSTECELDLGPWSSSGIEKCLPKLNCLFLSYHTEQMQAKWLDNFKSESVKEVRICLINEELEFDDVNFHVSIKTEMLAQVKTGFPNLRVLGLSLNFADMDVLKYVFENIKELTALRVHLKGEIGIDTSSKVDSLMVGLPMEVMKTKESFLVKGEEHRGIMNLSDLEKLDLWTENWENDESEDQRISLISDLFFGEVLLKMPKLRELELYGKFKPSDEMQQKWSEQKGRAIEYSAEM